MLTGMLMVMQVIFTFVIGMYFFNLLRMQQGNKVSIERESMRELEKLHKLKEIKLTEPLAEKTRPTSIEEIIGQEDGIKALRAALCGPNPQHVIIYGPPGVGKTAAARVILEEAKKSGISPFRRDACFVEVDATILRFDERGIADPLIGSVHDPIYQGAGAFGIAGIPQPKQGAVTKAHGGVLFIDEIGELHPVQMNKLLKVMEDRKVFLESSYYSREDRNIPLHIHEIFQKGLPADFRLVGATTRTAEDIPPALRSRCVEIYFRPLNRDEIAKLASNAARKGGFNMEEGIEELVAEYAKNGRDAVNIIQIAGSVASIEGRKMITRKDVEWVIEFGHYSPRIEKHVNGSEESIGCINGLAVFANNNGMVIDIEVAATRIAGENCEKGRNRTGNIKVTGMIEEEEMSNRGHVLKRSSSAKASVENVLTVLKRYLDINVEDYDIHLNFPGGIPIDGPSAGIAIAMAVYSAIKELPVGNDIAMTGELSIRGKVKPVGGVAAKIMAAKAAGIRRVLIPKDNWQDRFEDMGIEVIPVADIFEVINYTFNKRKTEHETTSVQMTQIPLFSASGAKEKLING